MQVSPLAGKPADPSMLVDVPRLVTAYYTERPDPSVPAQRVAFGTSGHRGSSLDGAFNEAHILAITQAICLYRREQEIDGPLYLGIDTHALSAPAFASALEVLAANGVEVMIDAADGYTPTPVISHAILCYNRGRKRGLADGIVVTPSHNPPRFGGFKYNPPHGGPADTQVTRWIEQRANAFIADELRGVATSSLRARSPSFDDARAPVPRLLRGGSPRCGGPGGHPRQQGPHRRRSRSAARASRIGTPSASRYDIDLEVVNHAIDPTFRFMTVDWDGQIRMDPSSRTPWRGWSRSRSDSTSRSPTTPTPTGMAS